MLVGIRRCHAVDSVVVENTDACLALVTSKGLTCRLLGRCSGRARASVVS